jgi:AI-2E family transporter
MTGLGDPSDAMPTSPAGASQVPDPRAMPPWLPRAIGLCLLGVAGLFVVWWLLLRLRTLLILLVVSLFLAIAIEPAVNALARRGWRRGVATAVVFLVLFVAALGFLAAIGSLVVDQVTNLADAVPGYVEQTISLVNRTFSTRLSSDTLVAQLSSSQSPLQRFATGLAGSALGIGVQVLTLVFQLLTVALFTFYLAADEPRFRRAVLSVLAPRHQREVLRAWDVAVEQTGGYVYSRALLAAVSATATWAFLWLIGCRTRWPWASGWGWYPSSSPPSGPTWPALCPRWSPCCRAPRRRLGGGLHRRLPAGRELPAGPEGHRPHDVAAPGGGVRCGDRRGGPAGRRRRVARAAGRGHLAGVRGHLHPPP